MRLKEMVRVTERGIVALKNRIGSVVGSVVWDDNFLDKPVIEVKGWVELCLRERGKIVRGSRREGNNIWTNTGREYLALHMSLDPSAGVPTPYRVDNMGCIGVGTGSQIEEVGVLNLVQPVAASTGVFLKALNAVSFPLTPVRTTSRYQYTFAENEITLTPAAVVNISELGLFTDGDPATLRGSGPRDTTIANAGAQSPLAYKTIEPVGKTGGLELEVSWEIRF